MYFTLVPSNTTENLLWFCISDCSFLVPGARWRSSVARRWGGGAPGTWGAPGTGGAAQGGEWPEPSSTLQAGGYSLKETVYQALKKL